MLSKTKSFKVHLTIMGNFFRQLGEMTLFTLRILGSLKRSRSLGRRTVVECYELGVQSVGIISITAIFVGMAFTVQVLTEFLRFGAGKMIGGVVGLAVWRELAPLLSGVVFAGRVGAKVSAELGTMTVTEQVEALEALSQDPIAYLVTPKVLACMIMLPLLVGLADIMGFLSGFMVVLASGKLNPATYFDSADSMLKLNDIFGGIIKAVFFGFVVGIISTFMGLKASAGAKGVGDMTTKAVVVSLIVIFFLNYVLSVGLFTK